MKQRAEVPAAIYASDRDADAIKVAQRTFQGAGVAIDIRLRHIDVLSVEPPAEKGVVLINPPYGVRLSSPEELESFYPRLGDWLKQRFAGWRACIFTGDARFPKLIGLAPSKRTPLFNGSLECRLYTFTLVQGSMRIKTPSLHDSP
jgi:putative N6-adenine-specific DNA methylase